MPQKSANETEIQIVELSTGMATACVIGDEPLIFNRMAEKAKRTLLLGGGRKTAAEKASAIKHNPMEEYQNSVNRDPRPDAPTRLVMPAPAFKGAMMTAALDIPGTFKTTVGRALCGCLGGLFQFTAFLN